MAKRRLSATKSQVPAAALTIRRLEAELAEAHGGIAELRASAETYFLPDARAKALHLEATIDALSFSLGDGHVSAGASAGIAVLDHAMYARKQERRAASAPDKV
jgi:hypothetical protein